MLKKLLTIPPVFCVLWLIGPAPAWADDARMSDFFGDYSGRTISSTEGDLSERDLSVSIKGEKKGFVVDWTTVTYNASGKSKRKSYSITFLPTARDSIFASAMKKNAFGAQVPLDPIKGEPYVWGRISGQTLTVYALHITDDGGYEMQVTDRTLNGDGLDLRFSRVRDGKPLMEITGTLVRTGS